MTQEVKPVVKMRLKAGAFVFQDFGYYHWPDLRHHSAPVNTLFDVEFRGDGSRVCLTAPGYGQLGQGTKSYGCGSIHALVSSLQFVKEKEAA